MINKLAFLVIAVFTLFLNSCAIPAALIGGGGTLYGLHKVAKHHYPNAVPDLPGLPSFSNILESSTDHNGLKSFLVQCKCGVAATVIEFDSLTNPVGTTP